MAEAFDLLAQLGKFGADQKISLRDPTAARAFIDHMSDAVNRALAVPILIHGQRAQAMFEALLVSLGTRAARSCNSMRRRARIGLRL